MTAKQKTSKAAPSGASDVSTIKPSPWGSIVARWRKGNVDHAAVVAALRSGAPVPTQANDLLAGLLDRSVKARKGLKPLDMPAWLRRQIARQVAKFETMLKDPSRIPAEYDEEARRILQAARMQRTGTPHAKAMKLVSDLHGRPERTVRGYIQEDNASIRNLAQRWGVTLSEAKTKLEYGKP